VRTSLQFATFSLIGVMNTLIQYVVFVLLLRLVDVPLLAASAVGYGCGLVNSYLMNRRWTFRGGGSGSRVEFLRFCSVNAIALGVNLLILQVLVDAAAMSPEIAQVPAVSGSLLVNFAGNKWWTFNARRQSTGRRTR